MHRVLLSTLLGAAVLLSVLAAPRTRCEFGLEIFNCIGKTGFNMDTDYSKYIHFHETEEAIDVMCNDLLALTKCVAGAARDCDSKTKEFKQMYADQYESMSELCDKKSSFRQEYLKHAKCLNANKPDYERVCESAMQMPADMPSKKGCERFQAKINTCESKVQKACGADALAMSRKLFKAIKNFFTSTCK